MPTRRSGRVDRRQHHPAARRHRRDGLVLRVAARSRRPRRHPDGRPAARLPGRRRRSARPSSTSGPSPRCFLAADPRSAWSPRTTASRATASTASRSPSTCRTPSRGPGTCSSASSGLRPPGWRPASTSGRRSSGVEPKFQRLGVNVLFGALLVVVLGSMAGEWLSVKQYLSSGAALVLLRPQRLRVHRPRARLPDRAARSACSCGCS